MASADNILELAIAYYKDKIQQELLEKFCVESRLLLLADAEARRTVARENILAMSRLKIELTKFKLIYNRISKTCGSIQAVDIYINEIEIKIKKLSYLKNKMK